MKAISLEKKERWYVGAMRFWVERTQKVEMAPGEGITIIDDYRTDPFSGRREARRMLDVFFRWTYQYVELPELKGLLAAQDHERKQHLLRDERMLAGETSGRLGFTRILNVCNGHVARIMMASYRFGAGERGIEEVRDIMIGGSDPSVYDKIVAGSLL